MKNEHRPERIIILGNQLSEDEKKQLSERVSKLFGKSIRIWNENEISTGFWDTEIVAGCGKESLSSAAPDMFPRYVFFAGCDWKLVSHFEDMNINCVPSSTVCRMGEDVAIGYLVAARSGVNVPKTMSALGNRNIEELLEYPINVFMRDEPRSAKVTHATKSDELKFGKRGDTDTGYVYQEDPEGISSSEILVMGRTLYGGAQKTEEGVFYMTPEELPAALLVNSMLIAEEVDLGHSFIGMNFVADEDDDQFFESMDLAPFLNADLADISDSSLKDYFEYLDAVFTNKPQEHEQVSFFAESEDDIDEADEVELENTIDAGDGKKEKFRSFTAEFAPILASGELYDVSELNGARSSILTADENAYLQESTLETEADNTEHEKTVDELIGKLQRDDANSAEKNVPITDTPISEESVTAELEVVDERADTQAMSLADKLVVENVAKTTEPAITETVEEAVEYVVEEEIEVPMGVGVPMPAGFVPQEESTETDLISKLSVPGTTDFTAVEQVVENKPAIEEVVKEDVYDKLVVNEKVVEPVVEESNEPADEDETELSAEPFIEPLPDSDNEVPVEPVTDEEQVIESVAKPAEEKAITEEKPENGTEEKTVDVPKTLPVFEPIKILDLENDAAVFPPQIEEVEETEEIKETKHKKESKTRQEYMFEPRYGQSTAIRTVSINPDFLHQGYGDEKLQKSKKKKKKDKRKDKKDKKQKKDKKNKKKDKKKK